MQNKKVSIIIPAYNMELYIKKSIESIIKQTYKNIEIIIIDDGSKDKTYEICLELKKMYENIILIKKENTGVSDSRNRGIEKATGDFIVFVDSDDYIEENMIEDFVLAYENENVDLVLSGFFEEYQNKNGKIKLKHKIFFESKKYNNQEEIKEDFVKLWDKHILYNICNKVYKRTIIEEFGIRFPNYNFGEDLFFNKEYIKNIKSCYIIPKAYYHYIREREGSSTSSYKCDLFEIRVKEYEEFYKYFEEYGVVGEESREFLSRRHLDRIIGCIENVFCSKLSKLEKMQNIEQIVNHQYTREALKFAKPHSKKTKILYQVLNTQNVKLNYLIGKAINFVRKKFSTIFLRLKYGR